MSNLQHTVKFSYYVYNMKPVTITLLNELPLIDKYYMEGDTLKVLNWYAKLLKRRNICEVKYLKDFSSKFNQAIEDQKLSKKLLIEIDQDFYFQFFDWSRLYLKGQRKKKEEKRLITFKRQREDIMLHNITLRNPKDLVPYMSFEECLYYVHIKQLKTDCFIPIDRIDLEDEDDGTK